MDTDAVWDGECGRSRDGCIRWGGYRQREGAVLGVNFGRPIVTNGDFVTPALPKLLWAGLVYCLWLIFSLYYGS